MRTFLLLIPILALLSACQTSYEYLVGQGYPEPFAAGYTDGCGSGRQAAGAMTGGFKKDVPRYLKDANYAEGWSDGFRQCQAEMESAQQRAYEEQRHSDRDEQWEQEKSQATAKALRSR
ncbi:MAG: hypothetical protein AAGC84_13510 [Pseudomonas sp.]